METPALLLLVRRNNLGQGQNKETGVVSLPNSLVYLCISCSIIHLMMKRKKCSLGRFFK